MTKQDYILIANAIVSGVSNYLSKNKKKKEDIDVQLLASIVTSICDSLYSQNTSFNRQIFTGLVLHKIGEMEWLSSQD